MRRGGFTLIETLVVVTIVIAISIGGFLGLAGYRNKQALESGLSEVRAAVEGTKRRSVTQEQGSRWGMRFTNATSGVSSYSVFKGSSYSTSGLDRTYSFRAPVGFGNPSASSTYDLIFTPLSGALSENKVLTLVGGSQGLIGDLILRTIGSITARSDKNVVGYWHLDEGTGTLAYDASGNANTGTLTNSPTWQSGTSCKAGSCLSFGGVNNYVSIADNATLRVESGDFTVSVWIYPNVVQQQVILFKGNPNMGNGYILVMNRFGSDITLTKGGVVDQQISYTFQPGNWYNIVAVQPKGGNVTYYINGQLIASYSSTSNYLSSSGWPLYIGDADTYFANKFNGRIDEVRIYNRALSASEILAHYNDLK